MVEPSIQYRIPLRGLKVSTNEIYAGIHWARRKQIKDSVLSVAQGFCRPVRTCESYPVAIRYRFIFGSKPLDTTNCTFLVKMLEDAFRAIGILEDDDVTHVASTLIEVVALPSAKSKKGSAASSSQTDTQDLDWVEIEINSL